MELNERIQQEIELFYELLKENPRQNFCLQISLFGEGGELSERSFFEIKENGLPISQKKLDLEGMERNDFDERIERDFSFGRAEGEI